MPISSTIGQTFIELKEADSTNNYAMAAAKEGNAVHGMVWFTDNQTAGKGQRGKTWIAPAGENLALSALLDTSSFQITDQFGAIMFSALAAFDVIFTFGKENVKIKWPNDIYINDKKAVGILTESLIKGQQWQWTVVGIGINVNQSSFEKQNIAHKAISLRQYIGEKMQIQDIAKSLCKALQKRWMQWQNEGIESLLKDYNDQLYKKNQFVKYKKTNGEIIDCIIFQVEKNGQLHVLVENKEHSFAFGEIELIMPQ